MPTPIMRSIYGMKSPTLIGHNYFYALTAISLFFLLLEAIKPWRKNQRILRRDFWLDFFYMYFNFFLFSLLIYHAGSDVLVHFFNKIILDLTDVDLSTSNPMNSWPYGPCY